RSARVMSFGVSGGVGAISRGECDVAPIHLMDPASGQYNKPLVGTGMSLVPGWGRLQGIFERRGEAGVEGHSAQEALKIVLEDSSALRINRNAGAGTRVLTDKLLDGARPA